jgi:hypothetical protein
VKTGERDEEMGEMVLRVEAAVAEAVLGSGASPKFIAKLGVFLANHPGLIGRAAIEAMRKPTDEMKAAMAPWSRTTGHHEGVWISGIDAALK